MFTDTQHPRLYRRLTALLAVILPLLAGCTTPATVPKPNADALKLRHAELYQLADLPPPEVRVISGDTLRILRDAQEPSEKDDMTLFLVRPDGYFSMPYVGLIKADGRTPQEVGSEISSKLAKTYIEPAVTVNIAIAPSNRVYVGGAVPNPAFFDINGHNTLEQALISSGGVLPSADSSNVALLRSDLDGKYKVYFFDFAGLLQTASRPAIALQRGDIIYVPQSGIGSTVEAIDMYFTRLIPINKAVGLGLNYDLNQQEEVKVKGQ